MKNAKSEDRGDSCGEGAEEDLINTVARKQRTDGGRGGGGWLGGEGGSPKLGSKRGIASSRPIGGARRSPRCSPVRLTFLSQSGISIITFCRCAAAHREKGRGDRPVEFDGDETIPAVASHPARVCGIRGGGEYASRTLCSPAAAAFADGAKGRVVWAVPARTDRRPRAQTRPALRHWLSAGADRSYPERGKFLAPGSWRDRDVHNYKLSSDGPRTMALSVQDSRTRSRLGKSIWERFF